MTPTSTTIDLELKHLDGDKEVSEIVQVTLQAVSPFKSMPVITENTLYNAGGRASYDWAGIVQGMASDNIGVIHPKNILDKIEQSSDPFNAIIKLGSEASTFCQSPLLYVLKRKESVQGESQTATGNVG